MQPVTNPDVPYVGPIRGGLSRGSMIRIQGHVPPTADRFNINLHRGSPPSDIALHLSVRLLQNYIARNALDDGDWGNEEGDGGLPIAPGQNFEILILCDPGSYKIAINGNHFCDFRHKIPYERISHIAIDGDVSLSIIAFESGTPAGGPDPYGPSSPQKHHAGDPPRPPGEEEEESGFEHFLETAGTVIAGAIATGAAHSIISSITGGGDRDRERDRHQQRAPTPPPQPQNPLFGLGGQSGGQGGNSGFVGTLLQTFAGELLGPKNKQQMAIPEPTSVRLLNQPPPYSMPIPPTAPQGYMPPLPNTAGNVYGSNGPPHQGYAPAYSYPSNPSYPEYGQLPALGGHPSSLPQYGQLPPLPNHGQFQQHGNPPMVPPYVQPPGYVPPPAMPHHGHGHVQVPMPVPNVAYPGQPIAMNPYGQQPVVYPHKKMKKSKLKKAMKYGLPVAGAGAGAYGVSHAMHHRKRSSSSSSSSD